MASEVGRLAERNGRDSGEQLLRLVYLALLVEDVPLAELEYVVRRLTALRAIRNKVVHGGPDRPAALATPVVSTDPVTGLPVVESPPDAPIYSMTAEQFQALIDQAQLEDDLERVGLVVRQ